MYENVAYRLYYYNKRTVLLLDIISLWFILFAYLYQQTTTII